MAHAESDTLMREAREWLHAIPIDDNGDPLPDPPLEMEQTQRCVNQIRAVLAHKPDSRVNLAGYDIRQRQLIMNMLTPQERRQVFVSEMV